jgi:hypothetical protein
MGDGQHIVHRTMDLAHASWLLGQYCQTPNFRELLEYNQIYREWHIANNLRNLLAVFTTTTSFTPILEARVLNLTSDIQRLESQRRTPTSLTEFDGGFRWYDIMQVVEVIRQSVGHYPFTYWNGQRDVRYDKFRSPSPEPVEHSRHKLTPQPHDVHMDTLLLMRSVLKK